MWYLPESESCKSGDSCIRTGNWSPLGMNEKLQKASVLSNPVMSVWLSVCPHGTSQFPLNGFLWNFILGVSLKSLGKSQLWLKQGKIMGTSNIHSYVLLNIGRYNGLDFPIFVWLITKIQRIFSNSRLMP